MPSSGGVVDATVVITTKNRKEDLRKAVASCVAQTARVQTLVIDDGSTDGTSEMIRAEFPGVTLQTSPTSLGYMRHRNAGARAALGPVVFSIDDDAVFASSKTVEQTLGEFDHGRVGVVAVPFVDATYSPRVIQRAPGESGVYVSSEFRGTAYAVRRDVFLGLGGFRELLTHQCEESDFAIRLLDAGYVIRLGRADPIVHTESPRRDLTRMMTYNARNNLLYVWQNVPAGGAPARLAARAVNLLRHGVRKRYVRATVRGFARAARDIASGRAPRSPVKASTYALQRELERRGATPMAEVEGRLPALRPLAGTAPAG